MTDYLRFDSIKYIYIYIYIYILVKGKRIVRSVLTAQLHDHEY